MEIKEFILGKGAIPNWFTDKCTQGKARVDYDDEGQIVSATIHTATKTLKAKIGDSILLAKSGLQVLPRELAKKNKVQKGKNNDEVIGESKTEME